MPNKRTFTTSLLVTDPEGDKDNAKTVFHIATGNKLINPGEYIRLKVLPQYDTVCVQNNR